MVRRGKIRIGPEQIRSLLHLPDDAQILALSAYNDPLMIEVIVSHDSIPESLEQEESYVVGHFSDSRANLDYIAGVIQW